MITERKYICSKEKYLELKEIQKKISKTNKEDKLDFRNYFKARREFYHAKGQQVPNYTAELIEDKTAKYGWKTISNDDKNGFKYSRIEKELGAYEPRYFNVIYALVKGNTYDKVENKVAKGNEIKEFYIKKYCEKYEIDFKPIRKLIWPTL